MSAAELLAIPPQGLCAPAPRFDRRRSRATRELWPQLQLERLGIRTLEVMLCVGAGDSNQEIARRLGISVSTVKYHITRAARSLPPTSTGRPPNPDEARTAVVAVLDDDPSMREAIVALIESCGLKTVAFASGADFLAYAADEDAEASCLVTDFSMPQMNGVELQEELGRRGVHLPTIMITAFPNAAVETRARASGAIGYLEKPVDDERLIALLQQAVDPPAGIN